MSDWLKVTSGLLDDRNIEHRVVEAFPNPGLFDGSVAEELMILVSGIKAHLLKSLAQAPQGSKERAKINGIIAGTDEMLALIKPMRYRATLSSDDIQGVLDGMSHVVRSLRESKSVIDDKTHEAVMKLIFRSRDVLMSYGVDSRQPAKSAR